jgi:LDH2 family malate/lactate/ureidoglycolate dehydrogenase
MKTIAIGRVQNTVKQVFVNAGLMDKQAHELTEQLLYSEQRGVTSHGLVRIQWILDQLHKYPNNSPVQLLQNEMTELYDADGVLGYVALNEIVKKQADAKGGKIKMIGVKNTYPTGALSYFAEKLAEKGWVVLMSSSSPRRVGMKGDDKALVGTNPWTFATPVKASNGGYAIVDTSLAELTHGQCLKHLSTGQPLPASAASISGGGVINNSSDLWDDGKWNAIIHTVGGEKAYKSFSVMWSLHMMASKMLGLDGDKNHGTFFILMSPSMWEPVISAEEVLAGMKAEVAFIETSKVAHVPGAGKFGKLQQNSEFIAISDDIWAVLNAFEQELAVAS